MIGDNIKRLRKKKGFSQEELAVKLYVVRQTVSKWENGLSVPDAEAVIKISEVLDVSVSELLGTEVNGSVADLTEELTRANEQLAQTNKELQLMRSANKIRGAILSLSFLALIFGLAINNQVVSFCLIGICVLVSLMVLYRNIALLTRITTEHINIRPLRITTIFDIAVVLICVLAVALTQLGVIDITEDNEKIFALALIVCVMVFSGLISPKLPYNRHTGLRLPWTIQDEDTWNFAHRIIGYTAMPIAVFYVAGAFAVDHFEIVTLAAMIAWLGLPSLLSYMFYYRKMHGKSFFR